MKVLIIEPDRIVAQSLSFLIGRPRFEVFFASSREEIFSFPESWSWDVVLCSDRLPDGDGLEVLRDLLRKNPQVHSILMSVRDEEPLREKAMMAGVRRYLVKPFDIHQLEEALMISGSGEPYREEMEDEALQEEYHAKCAKKGGEIA